MKKLPRVQRVSKDPTRTAPKVKKANADFKRRLSQVRKQLTELLYSIPYTTTQVNFSDILNGINHGETYVYSVNSDKVTAVPIKLHNATRYNYELDKDVLLRLNQVIADIINRAFMIDDNGNPVNAYNSEQLWFMQRYVAPAYMQGTEQARIMLEAQADEYFYQTLADRDWET